MMKRLMKIVQAHWIESESRSRAAIFSLLLISLRLAIKGCWAIDEAIYINEKVLVDFSGYVIMFINSLVFTSLIIINIFGVKGEKMDGSHSLFLHQLPVYKKDIFKARFVIIITVAVMPFTMVLCFWVLNLLKGPKDYISAYSGFVTLIYSLWFIAMNTAIGFSSLTSAKYKKLKLLHITTVMILGISAMYIAFARIGSSNLSELNIYDAMGSGFAPILKSFRFVGGIGGIFVIIVSIIMGYFLCCKLPLRISQGE